MKHLGIGVLWLYVGSCKLWVKIDFFVQVSGFVCQKGELPYPET
jgi:hypothetical protein